MSDFDYLIRTLEQSVEKNGEQPLTNRWLLNICKVSKKKKESKDIPLWEWVYPDDIY